MSSLMEQVRKSLRRGIGGFDRVSGISRSEDSRSSSSSSVSDYRARAPIVPQPPGLTEDLINQDRRRGIADVGDLRFSFGQEGQNMMDAARARAQSAFGTAAIAQNQLGGSAGAARRGLLMAQGATAGEDAVNSVRDQLQQRDLQAQGIRLQDVAAEAESRLGIDRFRESQRQFDLELERQREAERLELEKIRLAARLAMQQERSSLAAARDDEAKRAAFNENRRVRVRPGPGMRGGFNLIRGREIPGTRGGPIVFQ